MILQQHRGPDRELPIYGSQDGTKKSFVIDVDANERLVGMCTDTGDIVGRIRFVTSKGRKSPWYGTFSNGNIRESQPSGVPARSG